MEAPAGALPEKVEELGQHWTEDTGVGVAGPGAPPGRRSTGGRAENVSPAAQTFPQGTGHHQQLRTRAQQVRKVEVTCGVCSQATAE